MSEEPTEWQHRDPHVAITCLQHIGCSLCVCRMEVKGIQWVFMAFPRCPWSHRHVQECKEPCISLGMSPSAAPHL